MNRRGLHLASLGLLLGLATGSIAWGARSEASPTQGAGPVVELTPVEAPVVGGLAPGFELKDANGLPFTLAQARGRIVVLNFWATWCGPCRAELPLLEARSKEHASILLVVGINSGETAAQVAAYRDALGLSFPLLLDEEGDVQRQYRVLGYPTTFFVDEAGVVVHVHVGSMDEETLDAYLRAMGLS